MKRDTPEPIGSLAERTTDNGRRRLHLTIRERQDLTRSRKAEYLALMFLDLSRKWTYQEMARALTQEFDEETSIHGVKELIKTQEFQDAYNTIMPELGHDPRYIAARAASADLVSEALSTLENLLTPATPAGTRIRAVDMILKMNGLDKPSEVNNDSAELAKFLERKNIDVHNTLVVIPSEYSETMEQYTIDGEFTVEQEDDPAE